jgi:hypothetical protein
VSQAAGGTIISQCPFIAAPELIQMENGEIYEYVESMGLVVGSDNAEKRQAVIDRFNELKTAKQNELAEVLMFWGHSGDVI